MRRPDEEMERLEASLRARRPVARPEFKSQLDARVADGFRRFPRSRGVVVDAMTWVHVRLASFAKRRSRRLRRVVAQAGSPATQQRFSRVLWVATAMAGAVVASNVAGLSIDPADSGKSTLRRAAEPMAGHRERQAGMTSDGRARAPGGRRGAVSPRHRFTSSESVSPRTPKDEVRSTGVVAAEPPVEEMGSEGEWEAEAWVEEEGWTESE